MRVPVSMISSFSCGISFLTRPVIFHVGAAGFTCIRDEVNDIQDKVGIGCGQLDEIRDFLLYGFIQNRPFVCEAGGESKDSPSCCARKTGKTLKERHLIP